MSFDFESLQRLAVDALPAMLDSAVKGIALLAAAGLGVLVMRKASAAARQVVWVLALAALIALPLASAALPAWQMLPGWAKIEMPAPQADPIPVEPADTPAITPSTADPSGGTDLADVPRALSAPREHAPQFAPPPAPQTPTAAMEPAGPVAAAPVEAPPAPYAAAERSWRAWVGPAALAAWVAGLLACLLPLVLGRISLRRLARNSRRVDSGSWASLAQRAAQAVGMRRQVVLLQSDAEPMPMVWGVFRTRLLIPAAAEAWPTDRRWVVLLHELAHAKRRDCLAKLVAQVACALHWFNPLAWSAYKLMQREAEVACDDLVLSSRAFEASDAHGFQRVRPSDYAQHLLEIASGLKSGMLAAYSSIAMARKSKLEGRLLAILDDKRSRRALTRWGLLVASILVIAIAIPLSILKATATQPAAQDDKAAVTQAAVKFLKAMKDDDLEAMKSLSAGSVQGWRPRFRSATQASVRIAGQPPIGWSVESLKAVAREIRKDVLAKYPEVAHKVTETTIQGDFAATRSPDVGTRSKQYLLMVFIRTPQGWRFATLDDAKGPLTEELAKHAERIPRNLKSLGESITQPATGPADEELNARLALAKRVRTLRAVDPDVRERFLAIERFARMTTKEQAKELPRFYRELAPRYMSSVIEGILSSAPTDILDRDPAKGFKGNTSTWAGQLSEAASTLSPEQMADKLDSPLWLNVAARARAIQVLKTHTKETHALIQEDLASRQKTLVDQAGSVIVALRLRTFTEQLLEMFLTDDELSDSAGRALLWVHDPSVYRPILARVEKDPGFLARCSGHIQAYLWRKPADPVLLKLLDSSDAEVRYNAAGAVYECVDPKLAPAVIKSAKDKDARFRIQAAYLGSNLPADAFAGVRKDLLALLRDRDESVQCGAIRCFAMQKDLAVGPVILEMLNRPKLTESPEGYHVTVMQALVDLAGQHFNYDMHNWGPASPNNVRAISQFENWLKAQESQPSSATQPKAALASRAASPASAGSQPTAGHYDVVLPNGVRVELLGVARQEGRDFQKQKPLDGPWWKPDGSPLAQVPQGTVLCNRNVNGIDNAQRYKFLARASWPRKKDASPQTAGWPAWDILGQASHMPPGFILSKPPSSDLYLAVMPLPTEMTSTQVVISVPTGPWRTVASISLPDHKPIQRAIGVSFLRLDEANGKTTVKLYTLRTLVHPHWRVVVMDDAGKEHVADPFSGYSRGGVSFLQFDLALARIRQVQFQVRPLQAVRFRNISLSPDRRSQATAEILSPPRKREAYITPEGWRRVFIPNLDYRGPEDAVVLDLPSGRLLPLPAGKSTRGQICDHFVKAGAGQFAYDGQLINLNGKVFVEGKGLLNNGLYDDGPDRQNSDTTVYLLGNLNAPSLTIRGPWNQSYQAQVVSQMDEGLLLDYRPMNGSSSFPASFPASTPATQATDTGGDVPWSEAVNGLQCRLLVLKNRPTQLGRIIGGTMTTTTVLMEQPALELRNVSSESIYVPLWWNELPILDISIKGFPEIRSPQAYGEAMATAHLLKPGEVLRCQLSGTTSGNYIIGYGRKEPGKKWVLFNPGGKTYSISAVMRWEKGQLGFTGEELPLKAGYPTKAKVWTGRLATNAVQLRLDHGDIPATQPATRGAEERSSTIVGRVLDEPGGHGAKRAAVTLWLDNKRLAETVTLDDGSYRFANVPRAGMLYAVRVGKHGPGIWTEDALVDCTAPKPAAVLKAIDLHLKLPSLSGTVRDAETGKAVAGAELNFSTVDNRGSLRTDQDGRFVLYVLPRTVNLRCNGTYDRYYPVTPARDVAVKASQDVRGVDFQIRSAPAFSGRVLGADGKPAAGVSTLAIVKWAGWTADGKRISEARARREARIKAGIEKAPVATHVKVRVLRAASAGIGQEFRLKTDAKGLFHGYLRRPDFENARDEAINIVMIARSTDKAFAAMNVTLTTTLDPPPKPAEMTLAKTASAEFDVLTRDGQPVVDAKPYARSWLFDYINVGHVPEVDPDYVHLGKGRYRATGLVPQWDYRLGVTADGRRCGRELKVITKPGENIDAGKLVLD